MAGQGNTTSGRFAAAAWAAAALALAGSAGCGINKSRLATEQLVISDAVDRAVASIDFSPLSGQKVFFDTKYVETAKLGAGANVEYVISSLRQQMLAYDCRLQEKIDTADYVIEARVGVLNYDGHEVTYGVPGSAALSTASMFVGAPVPSSSMPELSLGRRNHQSGSAKIGLFAYDRQTREPVWQAGVTKGSSQARDMWIFGMGPYQQRATTQKKKSLIDLWREEPKPAGRDPLAAYSGPLVFQRAVEKEDAGRAEAKSEVATVSHTEPAATAATAAKPAPPVPTAPAPAPPTATPVPVVPAPIVPDPRARPVMP